MQQDPPEVVVAAYALALISMLVPLAVAGALFAGIALARRNRPVDGVGVIVVGVASTVFGVLALR